MTKFFVKKPYFVLVTVIIVLVVGFVSLGEMQTDLLPELELPYMAVITTEVGASRKRWRMMLLSRWRVRLVRLVA